MTSSLKILAGTLKPEYAEALREIDVRGTPVKEFAARKSLSSGNAGVRVFRARQALKQRVVASCGVCAAHGCVDCTCRSRGVRTGPAARAVRPEQSPGTRAPRHQKR